MRFIKMVEVLSMKNCLFKNKIIKTIIIVLITLLVVIGLNKAYLTISKWNAPENIIAVVGDPSFMKNKREMREKRDIRFIACSLSQAFPQKEVAVKPFVYEGPVEQVDTILTYSKKHNFYRFAEIQKTLHGVNVAVYFDIEIKNGDPPGVILSKTGCLSSVYSSEYLVEHNSNGDLILDNAGRIYSESKKWDYFLKQSFYDSNNQVFTYNTFNAIYGAAFLNDDSVLLQAEDWDSSGVITAGRNFILISNPGKRSTAFCDGIYPNHKNNPFRLIAPIELSPDKKQAAYWVIYRNEEDYKENNNLYSLWLSIYDIKGNKASKLVKLTEKIRVNNLSYDGDWTKKRVFTKWSPSPKYPYIATTPDDSIVIIDINRKQIIKTITMGSPDSIRWSGDGRYLGFVLNGSVHVYDTVKDTTTTVYWGIGCLDFIWVPRN